jgi:hypothetical protein
MTKLRVRLLPTSSKFENKNTLLFVLSSIFLRDVNFDEKVSSNLTKLKILYAYVQPSELFLLDRILFLIVLSMKECMHIDVRPRLFRGSRCGNVNSCCSFVLCWCCCWCLVHPCGLVVRVPGYRSRGPGSIPGATRFSEK